MVRSPSQRLNEASGETTLTVKTQLTWLCPLPFLLSQVHLFIYRLNLDPWEGLKFMAFPLSPPYRHSPNGGILLRPQRASLSLPISTSPLLFKPNLRKEPNSCLLSHLLFTDKNKFFRWFLLLYIIRKQWGRWLCFLISSDKYYQLLSHVFF